MPIDFAKYGGKNAEEKKKGSISLDFSKYTEPPQPTFQEQQKKFNPQLVEPSRPFIAPVSSAVSKDPAKSPVMQQIKVINSQPTAVKPNPVSNYDDRKNDKSRNIPIIGTILKGLDKLSDTKTQHVVANVGQALYTPGGGAANVAGLFGAAEKGIAKVAPNLVGNVAGRVAQKVGSGAITAFPEGVGQYQAQGGDNVKEALKAGAISSALGGSLGALGGLTGEIVSKIKKDKLAASFDKMFPAYEQAANNIKSVKPVGSVVKDTDVFSNLTPAKQFDLPNAYQKKVTLGLPEGNYTPPTRLKVNNPTETLDYVMTKIKPQVMAIIEAPTRRDLLVQYIQKNTGYEYKDIVNRPIEELKALGQVIQGDLHGNMKQIAYDVAASQGHDLPALLENQAPNLRAQLARDTQSQVYGVQPPKVGIQKPKFNVTHNADAAMPVTKVGRPPTLKEATVKVKSKQTIDEFVNTKPNAEPVKGYVTKTETVVLPDEKIKGQELKNLRLGDETGFANTVKNSDNTAVELKKALADEPVTGARTTDVLNRQDANKIITKHGLEGTHDILMSKTKQFSAAENTAAQIVAKHLSSLGGDDNLARAISLISKTAKGGREMGQAIQALSQWNKLDETGALMLGERQLNKGVKNTEDWKALTVEQGKPISEAAQRYGKAQDTKNLADEVLSIVTNKSDGAALTEAEKATIKEFQDQVKLINEKGKGILSKPKAEKVVNKSDETIKKVSQIEPKARTRDQVVSFLDAKADKARKRLAASRNLGFAASADKGNPIVDWAIIGAAHLAKKAVKLSDFTELMVRDFGSGIKPHINEVFNKATNIFRRENGLPTVEHLDRVVNAAVKNDRFTAEEAKQFKAWASEIGHMSEGFKKEATQDLQMIMKELGDSTLGEKIATIETGAMLLNSVTFERNILGNASQFLQDKISKLATIPVDLTMSTLTGERTIQLRPMNQEKFWQNWLIGTKSGWKGVSPTGVLESYDIHPNIFKKNNPFKYVTKALGASLQGFDYAFYSANKGDVLATYAEQMGKAQGLTRSQIKANMKDLILKLDDRIHDLADDAGKYATYQDDTMLSKGADMLKKGFNYPTDKAFSKLVDAGMNKKYSMEGYGVGTLVLKFAKTPANLVMRGLDFSPVGFIRAAFELAPLVFNKAKFNQFEASRALGRAITGTLGLTGMGYVLADAGILSGSYSLDKDKRAIEEKSGQGSYKVNWSALERFITSGFDYKEAKIKDGDRMMDYAWLQPMAISLAMGVNANKAVKEMSLGESINGWKAAGGALMGSLATVLENPMVQGLTDVIDASTELLKFKKGDKFTNIFKGVPARFIPTLFNQARTSMDNDQRETFDESLMTEIGNIMKNKIPGQSEKLPISYDSLGSPRERIQGGKSNTIGQYLTAFFSPARMTEYQVTPEAKLVLDLMEQSGDVNVLPRIAAKTISIKQGKDEKDLKVTLNATQYSQLQKNLGEMVKVELAKKSDYLTNPANSLENKVKKVKDILTDVGKKARENIGTQMGYKKKDIKS